ncbi:hypothetical protein Ddc_17528 [Ditylenchus destructor]|nr:hypothetical protein Ddc_17528 [Ditylenchus destructor]
MFQKLKNPIFGIGVQMSRRANVRRANVPACKCPGVQMSGVQMSRRANVRRANVPACKRPACKCHVPFQLRSNTTVGFRFGEIYPGSGRRSPLAGTSLHGLLKTCQKFSTF